MQLTDLSITEEAFDPSAQPDPRQGEPRIAGAVASTTSASTTRAAACSWTTCRPRRRWPAPARAGALDTLGIGSCNDRRPPGLPAGDFARGAWPFRPTAATTDWRPASGPVLTAGRWPSCGAGRCLRPERFVTLRLHTVAEGDRLDNLAAAYLGDPQQYWRLCDANGAMRPDELIEIDRTCAAHHPARRHAGRPRCLRPFTSRCSWDRSCRYRLRGWSSTHCGASR